MTNFNYANLDPAARKHFVYRCFDATGRLLYVGCTMSPTRREREHRAESRSKRWLPLVAKTRMIGPLPYAVARAIELEAIRTEAPAFNTVGRRVAR